MWDLAVREEDYEDVAAMLARFIGQAPLSLRLVPAVAQSDSAAVRALLAEGRTLESRQIQIAARYLASYLGNFRMADSLARLDLAWRQRPANRAWAQLLLGGLAAAGGRSSATKEAFRTAETMEDAGPVLVHRAIAATLPLQPVSPEDLREIRAQLERWEPRSLPAAAGLAAALQPHLRLYLLGLLSSRLGELGAAEQAAVGMARLPTPPAAAAVPGQLAATIRADVAWMQGRPRDVLAVLEGVDQWIPLELVAVSRAAHVREFGMEHARYLRATALIAVGREAEGLSWLRFGLRGAPQEYLYHVPIQRGLGEVFERLGQPDSAGAYFQRVIAAWDHADPAAAPLLEDLRSRLARVRRDTHP
jgi:tetratricopeptide (TPR) repeat protein